VKLRISGKPFRECGHSAAVVDKITVFHTTVAVVRCDKVADDGCGRQRRLQKAVTVVDDGDSCEWQ
jgi:hypothetical protein